MSFQWIVDNAESISIRSRPTVAATTSLDGTFRSTSQGFAPWTFEVQLPQGPLWSEYRQSIATAETLDRTTTANIQISTSGQTSWLNPYQGNVSNVNAVTASWTTGNTITLTGGQAASGYNFRAGDYIQLGTSGSVYRVASDVAYNVNTVTLHRPLVDAAGSATLLIGPAVTWSVRCSDFPQWTIFARDQISWSGPFIFVEDLT